MQARIIFWKVGMLVIVVTLLPVCFDYVVNATWIDI
jgi:hypothetical protein